MKSRASGTTHRRRRRRAPALIEPVEPRTLLATYYLSPTGDDSAAGTSASTAWRSLTKINTLDLDAGDRVLLQGQATFVPPAPSSTNRVSDAGFESGNFNTWNQNYDATAGNSTLTTNSADVRSGSRALRVGGSTFGGRGQLVTSQVAVNRSYLLRMWAKLTSGTGKAYGGITFYNVSTEVGKGSFSISGTSYKQYTSAVVAPPQFTRAEVWVTKDAGTSVLYADDFSLNESFGTLVFDGADSGTAASPVTISSYGSGRATIMSGDGFGLWARDVAGFVVEDLVFDGTWDGLAGSGGNVATGVQVVNTLPNNAKLDYIRIDNVEAHGFKWAGISLDGGNAKAGYRDVRITNCDTHDNGDIGIAVGGQFDAASTLYAHSGIYIGWCNSWNNGGIPSINRHSGSGMIIGDTDGGVIERSMAWNNGQNCNFPSGGPIGIWAWDSNDITIQFNESFDNKTGANSLDGGGFDFDGGVTNSLLQYNYSHGNDGAGYLMYQFAGARPFGNNTVRYNISQNDGRQGAYGGIKMGGGTAVANNQIYGNTLYLTPSGNSLIAGIKITGIGPGNRFRNNIVYTTGGVRLLDSNSAYSTSNLHFQGNNWYAGGDTFAIRWGGTTHADLSSWRNTGQEKNGTTNTGSSSNPLLVAPGGGGTIGDTSRLHTLTAYQLLASSPVINAGVNLASFGIDAGPRDYFGSPIPSGGFDIGAFEHSPSLAGSANADTFHLRLGSSGTRELFVNTPTSAVPAYAWASGVYTSFSINGNAGDDLLILNLANGNPLPGGGASFVGGADSDRMSVLGSSGNDVVAVSNTAVTPGGTGPSLGFSGIGEVAVSTGAGDDELRFSGVTSVGVPFAGGSGNDRLSINSGSYQFAGDASETTADLAVHVAASASVTFAAPQHLRALEVAGSATLAAGGINTLVTRSLSFLGAGRLNISDNDVVVDYAGSSPLPLINSAIASGRNDGAWNGSGIYSSLASGAGGMTTVGSGESEAIFALSAGDTALFAGRTVDATAVVVKYTYAGDANLDGIVSGDDYSVIDFHSQVPGADGYHNGDLNYDGLISGDDYSIIDFNITQQSARL